MSEETKNKVMGKINEIKSNIETFISDVNVNDLKSSFSLMVKDAQKDFNRLLNKDLEAVKSKFQKEKVDIEKKAKKFIEDHRKELDSLQEKFEKVLKTTAKLKAKAPSPLKSSGAKKKKASKKTGKKTTASKA